MVTLKDIAIEANVSITTVSNVVNGNHSKVSKKTISKIENIIKKYKYTPNMNAKALASNSSKIIGVITPHFKDEKYSFLQNPFNSEILSGIEKEVENSGYYLMIKSVASYGDIYKLLKTWNVDGAIILSLPDKDSISLIESIDIPISFIDSDIDNKDILNVTLDDENAAYLATNYLIENGHKNIGFITYELTYGGITKKRYNGFMKSILENNLIFNKNNLFQIQSGNKNFNNVVSNLCKSKDITALFVTADILALKIMSALNDNGIKTPDDISIIGFDGLSICELTSPKLTTIKQDIVSKGRNAAKLVIDSIEGKHIENKEIILPVYLIERESVKKIRSPL